MKQEPSRHPLAGDDVLGPLLAEFLKGLDGRLHTMREAWSAGDTATLIRVAHKLVGASATYGFPAISTAARVLEDEAKASADARRLDAAIGQLQSCCRDAVAG